MVENRFSHLLMKKRTTISQVHRATGISRSTLTKMYHDTLSSVNLNVLGRLCIYFDCQISDILYFEYPDEKTTKDC